MHNKMTETFCNIEKKTYVLQKVAQQRIKVCPENKAREVNAKQRSLIEGNQLDQRICTVFSRIIAVPRLIASLE